jgi:hypothetical protein
MHPTNNTQRHYEMYSVLLENWHNAVGIVTGYGLDGQDVLHVVQTGSWAHTASYPMGTTGSVPGGKAAGA